MENLPYDLLPDDDTEELDPKDIYRPLPPRSEYEFPDFDLLPEIFLEIKKGTQHS